VHWASQEGKPTLAEARMRMKWCRETTVVEVTAEWQKRASYHPLQVKERVLAVYKAKLEAAQRSDCHRAQWVVRMTDAVVEKLKQAGLTLTTHESPTTGPEPREQPHLEALEPSLTLEQSTDSEG